MVVLGCRVALDVWGRLRDGSLRARLDVAARVYAARAHERTLVVCCGGRRWEGGVEADVMGRELVLQGVPAQAIVRERCSLSTRENARFAREALARRSREHEPIVLVTSDWHMPRASALFRAAGFVVEPVPTTQPSVAWRARMWRSARERAAWWLDDWQGIARADVVREPSTEE